MQKEKKHTYFYLITFFLLISFKVFSQVDTVYIDENDSYISKTIFYNKMKSPIYKGIRFSSDTVVLEKLRFEYFFGKLEPLIKTQLFRLLNSRHKIDTTKTLVIHYQDTLKNKSDFPKQSSIVYYDSLDQEIKMKNTNTFVEVSKYKKIAKHKHFISYYDFLQAHKRCKRNHKKYNKTIDVLHFYSFNNGHPKEYKDLVWYKDYGLVIKKIFSDGYKNFTSIIVHPNGDFFIGNHRDRFPYSDLIKKQNWNKYKSSFAKRIKTLNNYNY